MAKVILKGHIIVPDSDISAVKVELINHIELTRQESGCLDFKVSQDTENLNKFNVYEEFTDRISFANHQDRVRQSTWGAITVNVERHYEITDVE
jgi:autoinducer 2-degrading protein